MSKFIPTKRGNPCAICGDISGKCREVESTLLCMTEVDAMSAAVPGYKFIGQTKNGFWGKFVTDQGQSWTQTQRQEWRQQQERIQQQRAAEEAKQRTESLPPTERDRLYRQLLDQLTLHPVDREDLQRRGLSDEQIAVGGFKSVQQWQSLETELSHRLPGVSLDGLSLNTQSGYLCPIKDLDGLIVGCQVRLRDADDGGRYRWLSSATRKRPNGPTPHLSSGELPLAVHKPQVVRLNTIGMTEGTGAKPFIAAQRLGQVVIGAAGGQFASSPRTLKTTLEQLGSETINFYVDAGSATNNHVLRQYKRTWQLLQQWGYQITVGWWEQTDKAHPDIDELSDYNEIAYISSDEFLEISAKALRQQEVKEAQAGLNALTYPALEVHQRYLDVNFPDSGIQFVKSPMGSGKTQLIKQLVENCQNEGAKLLLLGSRNGLLFQTCQRAGISHLHELQVIGESGFTARAIKGADALAMCVDSLWRIQPGDLQGATIIIDEVESVVGHLLDGSTCSKRRAELCIKLADLVTSVCSTDGRIILMDANLTDISIDYIKSLAPPNTPIAGIINNYTSNNGWDVHFLNGTTNGVKEFVNDDSSLINGIFKCLESGGIPIIPTDSQIAAETLEQQLSKAGFSKGLRVDGNTTEQDPRVKLFLENPNQFILDNRPQWLIFTPSCESGLSIDVAHFTAMFALFKGVIPTQIQMQMLARDRSNIPRYVCCVNHGFKDDDCSNQLPEAIERRLLQYHTSNNLIIELANHLTESSDPTDLDRLIALQQLFDKEAGTWNSPHLKTWAKLKARTNYSLANLRSELRAALIAAGHQVKDVTNIRACQLKDEFKELRDEIKLQRAAAIANAENIPVSRAKEILESEGSTLEERNQAHKAMLVDALPGVPLTPEFVFKAKIENQGKWLKQVRLDWMLRHPDVQAQLDRNAWAWQLSQPLLMPQDIRAYSQKLKVLNQIGLLDLLERGKEFSADSQDVIELMQTARSKSMRFKLYNSLGITVTSKTDPISFLKRILRQVGANLYCYARIRTPDGSQKRLYKVKDDYWIDPDRLAILEALNHKYEPLKATTKNRNVATAETNMGYTLDPCHHSEKEVYINSECWHTQEAVKSTANDDSKSEISSLDSSLPSPAKTSPLNQEQSPNTLELGVGSVVHRWGWGRAKYVVQSLLDEFVVEIRSLATGTVFTAIKSMLTPAAVGG
jgi:hypothetical protein